MTADPVLGRSGGLAYHVALRFLLYEAHPASMDPITQGAVGAIVAQTRCARTRYMQAAVIGAVGGMVPDLDVLIRSSEDPLLFLEYHRQFSHSLLFIPILGSLVGLLLFACFRHHWQITPGQSILWATLGCATHGLLDSCTSYGTQLLWPFSDYRVAWDIISIIDPLFTLPVIAAILLAIKFHSRRWTLVGIAWAAFYLSIGIVQHHRAVAAGEALAQSRGHTPVDIQAKPSFSNLIIWKVIYDSGDRFYVDAIKPGGTEYTIHEGSAIDKLDIRRDLPWLPSDSQQRRDIARFAHFSQGYIAVDPDDPLRIIDIRYSMLPQEIDPLWGIALTKTRDRSTHASFFTRREDSAEKFRVLLEMISN